MAYRITLIPGDGTGPELVTATRRVLEATGVEFNWDVQQAGAGVMDTSQGCSTPLPDTVLDSIRANRVALKGPITTPIFEPAHGSAPRYAGQNKLNPAATILSGALMLRHLGERAAAERVEAAVQAVIAEGKSVTYDLKPSRNDPTAVGTQEMASAIIAGMQ